MPFPYRYVLHTIKGLYSSVAQLFASEPLARTKWLPSSTRAAFKHEFYRYTSFLDFAGGISNEWSCGIGRIDVCIMELKGGFEFLRDGDPTKADP